jgi:aryl-alcohol dehydrogenase-like predicted oxidoreductase
MERRKLGALEVSAIGLGCATMTPFYREPDPDRRQTWSAVPPSSASISSTSDAYGNGRNEELIGTLSRDAGTLT